MVSCCGFRAGASCLAAPSRKRNASEETVLGPCGWRALANRLAADESRRVISTSNTMRRTVAILGSAIFLVIAPGIVAGYVPWRICRWHIGAPLLGTSLLRLVGVLLVATGLPVLLDSFTPFRAPRTRYTCTDLAYAAFGCQRLVSVRAKSHVCCRRVADSRSRAVFRQRPRS
jgi:hypothetical protein